MRTEIETILMLDPADRATRHLSKIAKYFENNKFFSSHKK